MLGTSKNMKKVIYGILAFSPALALAASNLSGVQELVTQIGKIINSVIPIMFALAIVWFFWGLIQFIKASGDQKAREEGRGRMIYGVIALAIMVSVYGLINYLQTTVNVSGTGSVTIPTVPGLQ